MDRILVNRWLGGQSGGGVGRGGRPGAYLRSSCGLCPAAPSPDALGPVTQLEEDANLIPAYWKNIGKVISSNSGVLMPVSQFHLWYQRWFTLVSIINDSKLYS